MEINIGIENHWGTFHQAGHMLNCSPRLPNWTYIVRDLYYFIIMFPFSSGFLLVDAVSSSSRYILYRFFHLVLYFSFFDRDVAIYIIFAYSIIATVTLSCIFIFYKSLLLNTGFSYFARFVLEFLHPVLQINMFAILQSEIAASCTSHIEVLNLVLIIIASVLIQIVYVIHKVISAHALFTHSVYLSGWNLVPIAFFAYSLAIIFNLRTLIPLYGKIYQYLNFALCAVCCIGEVIVVIFFPFYRKQDQFSMIFFWCLCSAETILDIFYSIWPKIFFDELELIEVFLIIGSYFISELIINKFYKVKSRIKTNNIVDQEAELIDLNLEEEEDFNDHDANSKNAPTRLVYYILNDSDKAVKFASFCACISRDANMRIDCYRYLALMHQLTAEHIQDIKNMSPKEISFTKRQLLCDLQFEVFSIDPDETVVNTYMNHLINIVNKCRQVYFEIIEMISMAQSDDIESALLRYYHYCKKFEKYAQIYSINVPNSPKLSNFISSFYTQIKADANLAVAWKSSENGLPTVSSDFVIGNLTLRGSAALRKSQKMSTHNFEMVSTQNLTSQITVNSIKSLGLRLFLLLSVVLFIFVWSANIYRISPPNFNTILEGYVVSITDAVDTLQTKPIYNIVNITSKICEFCDSSYSGDFDYLQNLDFLQQYHSFVSDLSDTIFKYNVHTVTNDDILVTWSSKSSYIPRDLTLHASESVLAILLESMTSYGCNNESAVEIFVAATIFNATIFANSNFSDEIMTRSNQFMSEFITSYAIYAVVIILILAILLGVLGYANVKRKHIERGFFWNSLIEIDPSSLSEVRQRLLNGSCLIKDSKFADMSSAEQDNILGSDELDNPSGSGDNQGPESGSNDYLPIDEYSIIGAPRTKKEALVKRMNSTSMFIIISVVFFLLWSILIGAYVFPMNHIFTRITYYQHLSAQFSQVFAASQIMIIDAMIGTINKTLSRTTLPAAILEPSMNFINERFNSNFEIDKSQIKDVDYDELSKVATWTKKLVESIYTNITEFFESDFTERDKLINATKLAFDSIPKIGNEATSIIDKRIKSYNTLYILLKYLDRVFAGIVTILYFAFIAYRYMLYYREFATFKNMLLVIPNTSKQAISMAVDLFAGSKNDSSLSEVSLSRHIIKQSLNGILMVSSSGIIQDVNNSAIQLLQRKKEDIIQQSVTTIIADVNENNQLQQQYAQLFEMRDDSQFDNNMMMGNNLQRSVSEIENTVTIRTGSGSFKLLSCKIIKISNIIMWGDDMSYAFILRDITEFSTNETALKGAQNRVESLLSKIMPKVIATRLMSKSDNEDIISCVDKAVIIFMGINNFISWCTNKNHEDIMQLLDMIFSKFDRKIAKYPTLVKIKMINGVYMAAAGLFNEVSDRTPVHNAVEFCLACGKWCMKRNKTADTPVHLNIGINYDGPIISGVLGREKPLFDVWGDAVNVSARLETSSYTDTIQMLPYTYHALPDGIYNAIERRDVFLKGKGTTNTFYIPIPGSDQNLLHSP